MAVTARNLVFAGSEYKPKDHAVLIETLTSKADGVISGCLLTKNSANEIAISGGYLTMHGRLIYVEGGTLSAQSTSTNTKWYVWCRINLSNGGVPEFIIDNESSKIDTENFNLTDGYANLLLGWFNTTSSGITDSSIGSTPLMKRSSSIGLKQMTNLPSGTVKLTNKGQAYKLGSIQLKPGQYIIQAYAWISGVSGGTGTSQIQIYNETTGQSLRTVCVPHTVNEKICLEAVTWITIPDSVGRDKTQTIRLNAQASYAGRSVASGEAGIGVCEVR